MAISSPMMTSLTSANSAAAPEQMERLDGPLEVLVRLDVAGVEDERIVELIALANPCDIVFRRWRAEAFVDAVVDDVNLFRRDVEVVEDVALRRLRHRQDAARLVARHPHRTARVRVAEPVREVLRKPQVDAVMNRHDRLAGRQRRQDVVRSVKQVGALATQVARHRDLLADRVAGRRLRNRAEIVAELTDELTVGLTAEHDILCGLIDAREVPKQVPDVGADPVVAELAGVDSYAQSVEILSGSAPFRRRYARRSDAQRG